MYYYQLKCVLYTPTPIQQLPLDFFGPFPTIDTASTKYLDNYKHANNKSNKIRRRSSVAVPKNTTPLKNIPPTPITTTQHHSSQGLQDQVDFRFGPIELQETNVVHTSKKKKRLDEKTVQLGYGLLRLYKSTEPVPELQDLDTALSKDQDQDTIICVLAVPSYMTYKDFTNFLGAANANITHYRFIRDYSPNKYTVLLKFKNRQSAFACHQKFNGRRFNMTEPEISHVVYIQSNTVESVLIPDQTYPYLNQTLAQDLLHKQAMAELPTCPVCLERMDSSITGLLGIQCHHASQCYCLNKWGENKCPVCRYSHKPVLSSKSVVKEEVVYECFECPSTESVWICMICGHIGCGRYQEAHAYDHYMSTNHLYALEIETQRVWDYVGDGYVHKLIQNTVDGAIVELPPIHLAGGSSNNNNSSRNQPAKLDTISVDYSYMLTSQLDSQRMYYEDQLDRLTLQLSDVANQVKAVTNEINDANTEQAVLLEKGQSLDVSINDIKKENEKAEKRANTFKERYEAMQKNLAEEKVLTQSLIRNNELLKKEAQDKDSTLKVLSDQGTSADQDSRFSNKEKKLLKSMSFPPEFDQKVDMKKVNLDVIKPWISNRITEILGLEDEVVIDYTCSLLEEKDQDPKRMQINLTGFLESNTKKFITELWTLLLSAQKSVGGIPAVFIEQKKEELRKKKLEEDERRSQRDSVMDTIRKKTSDEANDIREGRKRRSRFDEPRNKSQSRSPPRRYRTRSRSRSRDDRRSRHYRDDYYSNRDRDSRRRRRRSRSP
ncbi:hypothetical protein EDC94DRAFT_555087 [Helicostylum pulchrum]|nr:hypothetical protein EDC94DRAFT_555087 [Helicostylum pulchrum]